MRLDGIAKITITQPISVSNTSILSGTLQVGDGVRGSLVSAVNIGPSGTLILRKNAPSTSFTNGTISGSGVFRKSGTNSVQLFGNNPFSGTTFIDDGTLILGNGTSEFSFGGGSIYVSSAASALTIFNAGVFSNKISGVGPVRIFENVTLTGQNDHTGTITLSNGNLTIGDGGTTGAVVGDIELNNRTLTFNRSDDFTHAGPIYGAGNIIKLGAGKLTILSNDEFHPTPVGGWGTCTITD